MTLDDLLAVPYVANGRTQQGADCYGLIRMARVYLFGKPWMPVHGAISPDNKKGLTTAVIAEAESYNEVRPRAGAIAAAFRGRLCIHLGIVLDVDGRRMILETDEPGISSRGPRLVNIRYFEQRFLKVVYYDN